MRHPRDDILQPGGGAAVLECRFRVLRVAGLLAGVLFTALGPAQGAADIEEEPPPFIVDPYELEWELYELELENYPAEKQGWLFTTEGASGERLWSQTKLIFGVGLGTVGILYSLPEKVTGWDRDIEIADLPARWWGNVSQAPEWDDDKLFFNYIGHPYCGGVYYQMARKSGYSPRDSLVYATVMSTFFWEYGIEAFAENPSIQDIIVTPLLGWIYGEWAYRTERKIIANHNRVLGSKILGGVSRFILDPIDPLGEFVNFVFGREWVITGPVAMQSAPPPDMAYDTEGAHVDAPTMSFEIERRF